MVAKSSPEPLQPSEPIRKRVWAQDVAVSVSVLRARLRASRSRCTFSPDNGMEAIYEGVESLLKRAESAAYRDNPIPTRWNNWWRGTLIEAAYENLHAAEAEIAPLYEEPDIEAEVPEAVARVEAGLNRDDPRRLAAHKLPAMKPGAHKKAALRKIIEIGYAASDRQHSRVRSFRNIVLVTAMLIAIFVTAFTVVAAVQPSAVPLCFQPDPPAGPRYCPAGEQSPSPLDVPIVVLLGLLGGALSAAISIRNLRGTSTPYGIPAALALLKVPAGALTAVGALIAIRGEFIPGLSALDSQEQILAYALVFGYAQQLLTRLIDKQAQTVLNSVPSKDSTVDRQAMAEWPDQDDAPNRSRVSRSENIAPSSDARRENRRPQTHGPGGTETKPRS